MAQKNVNAEIYPDGPTTTFLLVYADNCKK
jgi:hypothetical protein